MELSVVGTPAAWPATRRNHDVLVTTCDPSTRKVYGMTDTPLSVSLFHHLHAHFGARLEPITCTKATLVHLSHTLEDLILRNHIPALLFTGFQESSHWREETARYRALADVAQHVCIFAGGQLPPESHEKQLHVTLQGDDPLRQEWFVCILSAPFSVVLCGQDRQVPAAQEATRQFVTFWTFDPLIINEVLDVLQRVVQHYRPDRAAQLQAARHQFPVRAPDSDIMTTITKEMIRFEEVLQHGLAQTSHLLQQQLTWRDDMVRLLVHDLRTPLQSVLLSLELASINLLGTVSPQQQDLLHGAERGVRSAIELVHMLLDSTKLEHGTFPLDLTQVSIPALLTDAAETIDPWLALEGIRFEHVVSADLPRIWADRALIARVVLNLLHNAIKFTSTTPGGKITLAARPAVRGQGIEIMVRDSGVGILSQDLPHVFERFAQGQTPVARTGAGLGLYFCRLAVHAHGGTIEVASQLGVGSTFTVTLPLHPPITPP